MKPPKLLVPDRRVLLPRIRLRERRPDPPRTRLTMQPHHLRYEVGRYGERLRSGPGGLGRGRVWMPQRVGEQHNLVLDIALDVLIADIPWGSLIRYAVVGSGSSEPQTSDIQLENEVARSDQAAPGYAIDPIQSIVADGVYRVEKGVEFTPDLVGGQNLTEWGWSPYPDANTALVSRELFRDGDGNPIALSIEPDQYLRLIYAIEITLAPLAQDVSITIENIGTLTGTLRLSSTAATEGMEQAFDYWLLQAMVQGLDVEFGGMDAPGPTQYAQVVWEGSITTKPLTFQTQSGRSRQSDPITFEPNEGNHEWRSLVLGVPYKYPGAYVVLNETFVKDDLHKLIFDPWTVSW